MEPRELDPTELAKMVELLEQVAADRGLLADVADELKNRLFRAAGRVAHPGRTARRQLNQQKKQQRRRSLALRKAEDDRLLAETGLRKQARHSPFALAHEQAIPELPSQPRLLEPRNCYICKSDYRDVHGFYDSLCPECAKLNWNKRYQTTDLQGRVALVTGGRVKIGFQTALKMLRTGCLTVVTTRFPHDAAQRFAAEHDAEQWSQRLHIHGLDMRHVPSVESLADHLLETLPRLDFILNNACQTVRKPPGFYAHLMPVERCAWDELAATSKPLLQSHYEHLRRDGNMLVSCGDTMWDGGQLVDASVSHLVGSQQAAELTQVALVDGDEDTSESLFPQGTLDQDCQQVDLREMNSWRLRLHEVSTIELLEVQLVNSVAPFVLNSRLKPLMTRVPTRDKHIVNVSAMEGVFYRSFKTDKHPHTNMAKAALNMMTRTSAQDYVREGIHMNSVDTGWITDEDPLQITQRKREEHGFHPPLDCIDAAARICDPIFAGFITGEHQWGHFWKDYSISKW